MTKSLDERLAAAKTVLDDVAAVLGTRAGAMPSGIEEEFRRALDVGARIEYWRELIVARAVARQFLDGLENRVDAEETVDFGGSRAKYSHIRLIGVEAYLSVTWSLVDRVTAMAGRVLCTSRGGAFNDQSPPQLVSHFVQDEGLQKNTAAIVFKSVQQTFGWPIGIAYAIRNCFIHDGAQQQHDVEFFEGRTAAAAFRISDKGWQNVERRATTYNVERSFSRAGAAWPQSPRDDLRVVLAACEREMDDALGVLVGSACSAMALHLTFMLGND